MRIHTKHTHLVVGENGFLDIETESGRVSMAGPVFCVNGQRCADFELEAVDERPSPIPGICEYRAVFCSPSAAGLKLTVVLRAGLETPVVRFRYILKGGPDTSLTNDSGGNSLVYGVFCIPEKLMVGEEVQLGVFDPTVHSFVPHVHAFDADDLAEGVSFMGPVAALQFEKFTLLAAYEHGSDYPDAFVQHVLDTDEKTHLGLRAVKGNYFHNQSLSGQGFESIWFSFAVVPGVRQNAYAAFREFILRYMADSPASRTPYIFYNSWNFQERQRYFADQPYLSQMNSERMCTEIDAAHEMGVDVFVIDTGWYTKTGDWLVNQERFPGQMQAVRDRLKLHGMKLGLWFNPTVAAVSSAVVRDHPEYQMEYQGQLAYHEQIWETEASYGMCLASDYADWFIEKLVQLHQELGVAYFKWDGISQYGCDSPHHNHGTHANSAHERSQCYAFEMGRQMTRIADTVSRRCPGAIVDFDVTEAGRFFGLGFLAAGKYFLINNGPYFHNFDIPPTTTIVPDTINVFFYPGAARPRVCRQGIRFDWLIPSLLFLTHYLPDPPRLSQDNSVAAMLLGGNGIWGDLPALADADREMFRTAVAHYKAIASDACRSSVRRRGFIGSSPEVYEKIDPETGRGVVICFTAKPVRLEHVTQALDQAASLNVVGADSFTRVGQRLRLRVNLERDQARVVYVYPK